MFCVLFGLSMDYQVFLLSRIRERWTETGDSGEAVVFGVRSTAGIITGAALIMVAVFAGMGSGRLVVLQELGFGLAIAVLLDAFVVRVIVAPALIGAHRRPLLVDAALAGVAAADRHRGAGACAGRRG